MAGSVVQATGRTDFDNGLRMESKLDVRNNLQTVPTIAEVNMASPFRAGQDPGGSVGAKFPCKSKPMSIFPSSTQLVVLNVIVVLGLNWPSR